MKHFSIIGANSSIARNFIYYLRNFDVRMDLYDVQNTSLDNIENYKKIDFLNKDDIKRINFNCDAVYVFSGLTGTEKSLTRCSDFIDVNVKLLTNLLQEQVRQNSKARLIYPSSRLVYKNIDRPLIETDSLEGKSVYAINKISAEHFIKLFNQIYGIEYTILRIAIPFGELNPNACAYGIVSSFYNQAQKNKEITLYGDGSGLRTFTHIEDLCNILYHGAIMEEMKNEIFNVGGCTYSLSQIASMQAQKTNARVRYIPWPPNVQKMDIPNGCLNFDKLNKILNINYRDIKQGLLGMED